VDYWGTLDLVTSFIEGMREISAVLISDSIV
jgi:hypothetical protein